MVSRDYWRFERTAGAFASLDGLRAIAVLLVVWRHGLFPFFEAHGRAPLLPPDEGTVAVGGYDLATIFINGWIGVDLFFVLSGFLIARQLLSLEQRPGGIRYRSYLLKRFLRIMPTYVFVLLMVALGLVPLYQVAPEFLGIRVAYNLLVLQEAAAHQATHRVGDQIDPELPAQLGVIDADPVANPQDQIAQAGGIVLDLATHPGPELLGGLIVVAIDTDALGIQWQVKRHL